jgi:cytochrome P450
MSESQLLRGPPGPTDLTPEALQARYTADAAGLFMEMTRTYGPVFKLPMSRGDVVFLNDARTAEKVLRLDFSSFGMSQQQEEAVRPLLGRSMPVVADHRDWEELHAIILPMFTPAMLRSYFEETARAVAEETDHLAQMAARGETVGLLDFVRHGIFTALTRTLFVRGVKPDDVDRILGWFAQAEGFAGLRNVYGPEAETSDDPRFVSCREGLASLNRYVYDLIAYRRANRVDPPQDMLDVLIAARKSDGAALTDVELRDNVMALFFGGQATTPSVITWAFGLLSANPDKRERMLEEIDRVLGGRMPTFEDLGRLEYTEMVLDEALRLYPPFIFVGREALEDVELGGYAVPKGTSLGFVGWTIHRDPAEWPDPEAFLPERHTRELKKTRSRCAFVAFGYGQRRCTGERVGRMESLLMLSIVSQRFLLDRVGGGMSPHDMSIKPADGLPMRITPRR